MTAEEKTTLAHFLDLTGDYLKDGHSRTQREYICEDDEAAEQTGGLPLAYTIEEPGNEDNVLNDTAQVSEYSEAPADSVDAIAADIGGCSVCALAPTRTNVVPGEGAPHPLVMVIGEGPGADEDRAGRPFVGKAGQLLDKMLASIGLSRDKNCFIANMVKCRPPGNRDPEAGEIAACFPYLERQINLLKPKVILCAGRIAAQNLLKTSRGINALRGEFTSIKIGDTFIPVLPTFHPSALLRDESNKRPAWEDLKLLRSKLESLGNR